MWIFITVKSATINSMTKIIQIIFAVAISFLLPFFGFIFLKNSILVDIVFANSMLILISMTISLILLSILIHSIINPTDSLVRTAKKISGGNIKIHSNVTSKNKVGQLAKMFNQMTDGITKIDKKLKESNLKLSAKILEVEKLKTDLKKKEKATLKILSDLNVEKNKVEKESKNAKKFQQAVESSSDEIIITDLDANIVYVNPTWEKTTGYTLAEVLGKNPRFIQSKKTPEKIHKKMWEALKKGESFVTEDIINIRKDGTEYQEHMSTAPVIIKGETIFYIGISQDITKRKEVDKMKSEFVAIASHQLRTPLTSIRWVIELFLEKEKITKQGKEYLQDIHASAQRLSDLVDILLNVSRIEEGNIGVSPRPIELVNFINNYLKELEPLTNKKNLTIKFNHSRKLEVLTDKNAFQNVIQSLVSNSVEYTPDGGKIGITLEKNKHEFCMKISDSGIGIPKEEQKDITHKFTRGSNAMLIKTAGTGMGLYIAYEAVHLLGGKIWFESEENKGTTFHVILPLKSAKIAGIKKLV